jgi:hypothetical protein
VEHSAVQRAMRGQRSPQRALELLPGGFVGIRPPLEKTLGHLLTHTLRFRLDRRARSHFEAVPRDIDRAARGYNESSHSALDVERVRMVSFAWGELSGFRFMRVWQRHFVFSLGSRWLDARQRRIQLKRCKRRADQTSMQGSLARMLGSGYGWCTGREPAGTHSSTTSSTTLSRHVARQAIHRRQTLAVIVEKIEEGLAGTQSGEGSTEPIMNVAVEGGMVSWTSKITKPMRLKCDFKAVIDGDQLTGKVKAGIFGSFPFTGQKMS